MKVNKGLVFLDHHHALSWLVDDRCTFRCVTQCVAFIVAFSGSLAQQRFALLLTLRRIIFLHQDESDIFLNARLTRFLVVSLVTILVWDLNRNRNILLITLLYLDNKLSTFSNCSPSISFCDISMTTKSSIASPLLIELKTPRRKLQ